MDAIWLTAAEADKGRTVLYLHGGGYVFGSIGGYRGFAGRISRAAKARVLLPEYRLAPECSHPAATDDALTAYRWLVARGVPGSSIVVVGDSAGGGLAIALASAVRDAGLPTPAAIVAMSPWVDLECTGETMASNAANDPVFSRAQLLRLAAAYLGNTPARGPLASPLYADLTRLPPILIQVSTSEILLDDARRIAQRARDAGVAVTYDLWDGMIHDWQFFAPLLEEGQLAIDRAGEFIRQHTPV
jgi:acetyl esterase/lipase